MNDKEKQFLQACRFGHLDVVRLLIDKVNINAKDDIGNTALILATSAGSSALPLLIEKSCGLDVQNNIGLTALMFAARYGDIDTARLLIKNGAKLDIQDINGCTALLLATMLDIKDMPCLLVENGANLNIMSNNGKTVFDYRITSKEFMFNIKPEVINYQDINGDTLLMKACQKKNEKDVLFLIKQGADTSIINNKGDSVFQILKRKKVLPPLLQAFKEKIMLVEELTNEQDYSFGL